jgi:hypothetical protein
MFFSGRRQRLFPIAFVLAITFYALVWRKWLKKNSNDPFEEEPFGGIPTFYLIIDLNVDSSYSSFPEWFGEILPGRGPDYKRFRDAEHALPQHNLDRPPPEGKHGKYVKFSNQIYGSGWNHVFTEL